MPGTVRGRSANLTVRGVQLETRRLAGDAARPTLVLLHEGLGCVALWRDFPERLLRATGCGVFAYSRAGYGGSDPVRLPRPLDYMSREAIDVLPAVLAQAGIEHYVLLGHSDGASIALVHAGTAPRGLAGTIVMAPHVVAEPVGIEAIRGADRAYREDGLRERLAKYHGSNVDVAFRGWCDSWLHPDFLTWTIEADLTGIAAPILQIQGTGDEYGTAAQLDRIERGSSAPVTTVLLEECGHAPQFDQCEKTLAAITDFLTAIA